MRVLVCGGRDFIDTNLFLERMNEFEEKYSFDERQPNTIIEGGSNGADAMAARYAAHCGWLLETFPAAWKTLGRAAGPIRNKQMIDEGKPDLVIAFPGGKGTANMIKQAKEAGILVEVVNI